MTGEKNFRSVYVCIYVEYLLTECEVDTEKYLSEVFVQTKRRSEVYAEKTEGKYFPVQTEQTKLIRNLLFTCSFWFLSSSLLTKLCIHQEVA